MLQAVEERIDQRLLLKQLVPVGQVEIRRDDRRQTQAVALVHQAEERIHLLRFQVEVAEFVDGDQRQAAQLIEQPDRRAVGERGIQLVEQTCAL